MEIIYFAIAGLVIVIAHITFDRSKYTYITLFAILFYASWKNIFLGTGTAALIITILSLLTLDAMNRLSHYLLGIYKELPSPKRPLISKALKLWALFPIVMAVSYGVLKIYDCQFEGGLKTFVYSSKMEGEKNKLYACAHQGNFLLVCECVDAKTPDESNCPTNTYSAGALKDGNPLVSDIHIAIQRLFNTLSTDMLRQVEAAAISGNANEAETKQALMRTLFDGEEEEILLPGKLETRFPGLKVPDCNESLWDWMNHPKKCIKKQPLEPLNNAYTDMRNDLRNSMYERLRSLDSMSDDLGNEMVEETEVFIQTELEAHRIEAHTRLNVADRTISLTRTASFALWLLGSLLAVYAGFAYILTRVAYDTEGGNMTMFYGDDKELSTVKCTPLVKTIEDTDIEFNSQELDWFVCANDYAKLTIRPSLVRFQTAKLFFKRLFRKIPMREIKANGKDSSFELEFIGGAKQIYRVELGETDSVIFEMKNLIAVSSNVTLDSYFSWSAAYLLGRNPFLAMATGKGQLVFGAAWSAQKEKRKKDGSDDVSTNPENIVMLDAKGKYRLGVSHALQNTYWDDHTIVMQRDTQIIVDAAFGNTNKMKFTTYLRKLLLVPIPIISIAIAIPILNYI